MLDLVPNAPGQLAYRDTKDGWSSWGSSPPIRTPDGTYHLYATRDINRCPVVPDYTYNEQLIHATSSTVLGPYTFANVALDQVIINPHVVRAPGGELVLFYSGESVPGTLAKNCTRKRPRPQHLSSSSHAQSHEPPGPTGYVNDGCVLSIATAQNVSTPFASLLTNFTPAGAEKLFCRTNPTAFIFPNGTTLLYFRSAESNGQNEQIWLAIAPSYRGPYTLRTTAPVGPTTNSPLIGGKNNEDPFIYRTARGFILMMHMSHWGPGWNGAKAWSEDGISWHWTEASMSRVWNSTVSCTDGSSVTFRRREEPKIYLDERGMMRAMFNAVTDPENPAISYVMSQAIRADHSQLL
eukprot:SAG22_NODE_529_length_9428_cov_2.691178_9_plen_351_part_00